MDNQQIIRVIDFWQKTIEKDELKDRSLVKTLDYKSKEIIDLIGPRRSGKSSILKLIIKHLNLKNNYLFINFEDPFFIENNKPHIIEEFISVFKEYFNPELKYLFLDEIQEIEQWESVVRKLRDSGEFKIFITGSSSSLLSGEISTLLTGRHLSYQVFPLSFSEFLIFKNINIKGRKDIVLNQRIIARYFYEYMDTGSFPEIVLTGNSELVKNYFYDILQKDIVMRYNIREKEILERIAVYTLSNSSKIISLESLKKTFDISFALASSYIDYLKNSFLIFELFQFSYSLKKQQKALKKIYTIDSGIANAVSFRFSKDSGRILENIVFLHLKMMGKEIYYYKTKNNLEVDFIVKKETEEKELIQVSWSLIDKKTREREIKSLLIAMSELSILKGLILTDDEEENIEIEQKTIIVKPAYKWLLENKIE
ncbi:MAG TPA: ATP-binding protein [Candidatus Hydromicrobium sp.]